jgi:hypothetical protein
MPIAHVVNLNIAIDSLPTFQISLGIVVLFEKIYDGEPILTVISNIREDVQCEYRCFNEVYDMKSVSQPDTMPRYWKTLFANNRNRVRGAVLGVSQDGACANLFKNFHENSLKRDLSNDATVNPPLFSLINTFNN